MITQSDMSANFQVNDCILEQFITISNGAVACIGNDDNNLGDDDDRNFPGQRVTRYFHDAIFNKKNHYLGVMHAIGKEANTALVTDPDAINTAPYYGTIRYSVHNSNLLGDPALSIWTATPDSLDSTYASPMGTTTFEWETGHPYTWVALLSNDDSIICTQLTDSSGSCSINEQALTDFINTSPVFMKVRAKAHNCYPFEGYIEFYAIEVRTPNGGELWFKDSTYDIEWDQFVGGNVKIELYKGGDLHSTILNSTAANSSPYSWDIPDTTTVGSDYKVRITSIESPTDFVDTSDSDFSIVTQTITVTYPTGDDTLYIDSSVNITWYCRQCEDLLFY